MTVDRQHVAYHEAGHAVICLQLGHEVRNVTIKPDKRAEGRTNISTPGCRLVDSIKIDLAGAVAESLVNPFPDKFRHSGKRDWRGIRKMAQQLNCHGRGADEIIAKLMVETEALVLQNKQAIIRVAEGLLKHGTLTGDEVRKLIGEPRLMMSASECDEFRELEQAYRSLEKAWTRLGGAKDYDRARAKIGWRMEGLMRRMEQVRMERVRRLDEPPTYL